jgi:hypothetical protein
MLTADVRGKENVLQKGANVLPSDGTEMARLYKPWDTPSVFGDLAVLGFLLVQCLDGVFTYLGVQTWGPGIEANPLISLAVSVAGLGLGLAGAKLMAVGFGILLHLLRIHLIVALLTAIYVAVAILPWTALFLTQ